MGRLLSWPPCPPGQACRQPVGGCGGSGAGGALGSGRPRRPGSLCPPLRPAPVWDGVDLLVGSLCSSSASLVCCPGLDLPGFHHLHLQSMAGSVVCRGRWACAVVAASLPLGHSLHPRGCSSHDVLHVHHVLQDLHCRIRPHRRSVSYLNILRREVVPSCGGSVCSDSCQRRTCCLGLEHLLGR